MSINILTPHAKPLFQMHVFYHDINICTNIINTFSFWYLSAQIHTKQPSTDYHLYCIDSSNQPLPLGYQKNFTNTGPYFPTTHRRFVGSICVLNTFTTWVMAIKYRKCDLLADNNKWELMTRGKVSVDQMNCSSIDPPCAEYKCPFAHTCVHNEDNMEFRDLH